MPPARTTSAAPLALGWLAGWLALALLAPTLAPAAARAQEPDARGQAMQLFRESATEYQAGRFAEAAALLRRAFALAPEPVLQYNLARALEGMGDMEGAIEAYETYLELDPGTGDRGAIEARLRTLRTQAAELAARDPEPVAVPTPEPVEPPSAPAPRGAREPSPAPWIVVGVGVLGIGGAAGLGAYASALQDDAASAPDHRTTVARAEEAQSMALGANVTFAVAGTIALAGLVWGLVDVTSGGGDDDVAVHVGPGSIAVRASLP